MPVEPWGAYPPEVNAGRFTAGGGPASWLATSLQWKAMAALVAEQIVVLEGITGALLNDWQGVSGPATAQAFTPYKGWLHHMESIALANSAATDAVVAAYGGALAGLVPVPVIAANRAAARTAESTAQAATVAAAVPGAAPAALGVAATASAAAAELEAQYSAMWGVNGATMAGYDAAVTSATTPKIPAPPPPIVLEGLSGKSKSIQELVKKHGGSDDLVRNIERQIQAGTSQAQSQIAQAQQAMGSPAVQNSLRTAAPVFRSAGSVLSPFSRGGYTSGLMGNQANSLSDSEFRSMLGGMSQSGGGLRGMSSLSHGGGPGSSAAFSSGSGGQGSSLSLGSSGSGIASRGSTSEASLGILGGTAAAAASSVFSGIPPTPPAASPSVPAGGMMAPHGGMAGARGAGEGGSKKSARVVDRDSFYDLIDSVRSTATVSDTSESAAAPTTGNASAEERSRALVDKITDK